MDIQLFQHLVEALLPPVIILAHCQKPDGSGYMGLFPGPLSCCFCLCGSLEYFEISYCDTSAVSFSALDRLDCSGSLVLLYEFQGCFSVKSVFGVLMLITSTL